MIVGASEGEGEKRRVELLDVPNGVQVGERIRIEGCEGLPDKELDFHSFIGTIQQDLYTDGNMRATYKGKPLLTSLGPITVQSIRYGAVA